MASIRREISIDIPAAQAWAAMRDVGALHTRLAQGFVADCRLDGEGARIVSFVNGMVVRELIVTVDDDTRRVVWAAVGGRLSHHNASTQVADEASGRCRVVWQADLLPDTLAPAVTAMIEQGMAAMKRTLESAGVAGGDTP